MMATVFRCDCCKSILDSNETLRNVLVDGDPREDEGAWKRNQKFEKEIREEWCSSCILSLRNFIKDFRAKLESLSSKPSITGM